MSLRRLRSLVFVLALALVACDDGSSGPRTADDDAGEPAGDDGGEGGASADDCEVGTLGCPCGAGKRCALDDDGERLVCAAGLCQTEGCPLGNAGCACKKGVTCADEGLACVDGTCMPDACEPGSLHCACLQGSCDPGSYCDANKVCQDARGREGGACLDNGACLPGALCDKAQDVCVYCERGSEGCACADGTCNAGLACAAGSCVSASSVPPSDPACYTPCAADLIDGSEVRRCDGDGLIAGCVDGKSCVRGSCLGAGEDPPSCADDMDCPFFQTCLGGECFANCTVNADCAPGLGCYRKVCRPTCSNALGAEACPDGMACTSDDGDNGFCSPAGRPVPTSGSTQAAATLPGGITLPVERLELSNLVPDGSFPLANGTRKTLSVSVHKLWHIVHYADGTSERVDARRNPLNGEFLECNAAKGECPLYWLAWATREGKEERTRVLEVEVPAECGVDCPAVYVKRAAEGPGVRWEGELLVESDAGSARVFVAYVQTPEGRWSGSMYYFGSFGDEGLADWAASPDKSSTDDVKNALVQVWGAFRRGTLDNWDELQGVLSSTYVESWKSNRVRELCSALTQGSPTAVCYPHTNPTGVRVYAQDDGATPVPSGVSELPFAVHVRRDRRDRTQLRGVIDSATALHYPGQPEVLFDFAADPAALSGNCDGRIRSDCVVFLDDFRADSAVGGRYRSSTGRCDAGFTPRSEPWLLNDFVGDSAFDPVARRRTRVECRYEAGPFDPGASDDARTLNVSLAGANPAPDGTPRTRSIRMLDGALVNQNQIFVLFEESFPSFVPDFGGTSGTANARAYGFIMLKREARELTPADVASAAVVSALGSPDAPATAVCSADLIERVGSSDPSRLAQAMLSGLSGSADYAPLSGAVYPHYLCEETGVFDNGYVDPSTPSSPGLGCPPGSRVTYFLASTASLNLEGCQRNVQCDVELAQIDSGTDAGVDASISIDNSGLSVQCRQPGTCKSTLSQWVAARRVVVEVDPLWECTSGSFCDGNRFNLLEGKRFYRYVGGGTTPRPMPPIATLLDAAFRYKTRFQSASGGSIGFAPKQCEAGSEQVPYCYDAAQIEDLRDRVDCLLHIYTHQLDALSGPTRLAVEKFLRANFARFDNGRDGFERLYSELLTMLGDDAVSASYASRFDLAGSNGASFLGSGLEPGGPDLTGVPGYELAKLYQGVQYYQLALDRLYLLGPNFGTALSRGATSGDANFVSPATVTAYLERLAGASAKKARAWSEISRRYLGLNRADLARAVISREYLRTYLEGVMIAKLMARITEVSRSADVDQIRVAIEQAQRGYRMALIGMSETFASIDDSTTIFGFQPDYIPFPALDSGNVGDTNAFEVLAAVATRRIEVASQREDVALASNRSERVDAAAFQSELVRIRNTYEDQLADLCGTFVGDDGRVYPATDKYAGLSTNTRLLGDPCGRVGTGQIRDTYLSLEDARLNVKSVVKRAENLIAEIQIERQRVSEQCGIIAANAKYEFDNGTRRLDLTKKVQETQATLGATTRSLDTVVQTATIVAGCSLDSCLRAYVGAGVVAAALTGINVATSLAERDVNQKQNELAELALTNGKWIASRQCDVALVDSNARTRTLGIGLAQVDIDLLRANQQVVLSLGQMQKLSNQAKRLRGQQAEAEQMLINTEAARNDPNVRIYRNDAVINADFTFDDALRAAYRATRVYEYYTSQSYAKKDQLFLIRMASSGQYNLQNYMTELQNAFYEFEETYGVADTRVAVLSLRDDILRIPLLDEEGTPYSRDERVAQMRERLRDPALLDRRGYLVLPFSIPLSQLSPVTRNHKIRYLEADVVGSSIGDTLGRVYLRQVGTGSLRTLSDDLAYYAFPERMAVLNTFFNGSRVYGPDVYRSFRLRDRPIANSLYELIINQRDEAVNADIDLQSLTDIRLLVYYDDFTQL
jgi:hypothetical protein